MPAFWPGQGIRQGCCASPYLFLLVAELLAISIREDPNIKGVCYNGVEIKLTQFADDVTCMLATEDSLTCLIQKLGNFLEWPGLNVNRNKTKIMSHKALEEGMDTLQSMPVVDKVQILGIWIGLNNSEENRYEWNYKHQIKKIQGILGTTKSIAQTKDYSRQHTAPLIAPIPHVHHLNTNPCGQGI